MIEEIDALVGVMLCRLDTLGIIKNTLDVFNADRGEMLGANCVTTSERDSGGGSGQLWAEKDRKSTRLNSSHVD